MDPIDYVTVGHFRNDTSDEMRLFLEMSGEEVVLSPGQAVELLAKRSPNLLPVTMDYVLGGIQIHPWKEFDPDWHIRFKEKLIRPQYPTRLSEHE